MRNKAANKRTRMKYCTFSAACGTLLSMTNCRLAPSPLGSWLFFASAAIKRATHLRGGHQCGGSEAVEAVIMLGSQAYLDGS